MRVLRLAYSSRGVTLPEVLVAALVLGLLSTFTFTLFTIGTSGFRKMEAQSGLLADYQVLHAKLSREIKRSVEVSASSKIGPNGETLAFLSAIDSDGVFSFNPISMAPIWQKYLIFYHDQAAQKAYMLELPLASGSPEIDNPEPLEDYDAGSGDLENYRTGGRLLMKNLDECSFSLNNSTLRLEIKASRKRYGDSEPERLHMESLISFRN